MATSFPQRSQFWSLKTKSKIKEFKTNIKNWKFHINQLNKNIKESENQLKDLEMSNYDEYKKACELWYMEENKKKREKFLSWFDKEIEQNKRERWYIETGGYRMNSERQVDIKNNGMELIDFQNAKVPPLGCDNFDCYVDDEPPLDIHIIEAIEEDADSFEDTQCVSDVKEGSFLKEGDIVDATGYRHYTCRFVDKNGKFVLSERPDVLDGEFGVTVPRSICSRVFDPVKKYKHLAPIVAYEISLHNAIWGHYKFPENGDDYVYTLKMYDDDDYYYDYKNATLWATKRDGSEFQLEKFKHGINLKNPVYVTNEEREKSKESLINSRYADEAFEKLIGKVLEK